MNQASLSIAKIAVLASLLFISSTAYAQDRLPGTWKNGFAVKHVAIPSGQVGAFTYSSSSLQAIEYAPSREYGILTIQFSFGAGITDQDLSAGNVYNNASLSYTSKLDSYWGLTVLSRVSSSLSLGLSNMYATTSRSGPNFYSRTNDSNWGFALSFHKPGRTHALEVSLGEDASTIGYRWAR